MIIRLLGSDDLELLNNAADDVFDNKIEIRYAKEFLDDSRHHIIVAIDDGKIVGFVSGVHYLHPDKPTEMFINEAGVAPSHQRRGIAKQLMTAFLSHAKTLGCTQAWVATEPTNPPAQQLYASAGGIAQSEPFVVFEFDLTS